eukprot:6765176-Lingulodinium_polyedra.AAC.1
MHTRQLLAQAQQRASASTLLVPAAAVDQQQPDTTVGQPQSLIAKSALHIFRDDWFAARRREGVQEAWQASMWPEIRRDFDSLPPSEREDYAERARQSKHAARRQRALAKAAATSAATQALPAEAPAPE